MNLENLEKHHPLDNDIVTNLRRRIVELEAEVLRLKLAYEDSWMKQNKIIRDLHAEIRKLKGNG